MVPKEPLAYNSKVAHQTASSHLTQVGLGDLEWSNCYLSPN